MLPFRVVNWLVLCVGVALAVGCDDTLIGPPSQLADATSDVPQVITDLGIGPGPDVHVGCSAESCAAGYHCVLPTSDATPTCLPDDAFACAPCTSDAMCLGGRCVDVGGEGKFCEIPCVFLSGGTSSCPTGTTCQAGDGGQRCIPDSGSCTCGAANAGQLQACAGFAGDVQPGQCARIRKCAGASGWSACSIPAPTTETCNGVDDDCDAQTDEGVAGGACGTGACAGAFVCDGHALACDGPAATTETCNGQDDDCDGVTDNGFVNATGLYASADHCGSCGTSCAGTIAHGTATCQVAGGHAGCGVAWCDPGYWKVSATACQPTAPFACAACTDAADCGGDPCVDGVCRPVCTSGAPCGPGFVCADAVAGVGNCVPKSGTCSCTVDNAGASQACANSNDAGICTGTRVCNPGLGWSACSAPEPATETCNGADDDCDGSTDEDVGAGVACLITNSEGACPGVLACDVGPGLHCAGPTPAAETCNGSDDDCDGATDEGWWNPASLTYDQLTACGACGVVCPSSPIGASVACAGSPVPSCQATCLPGWVDLNGTTADGCECQFQSATDEPDGIDQNCDGIDGYLDNAVFVAKSGSDSNAGTATSPVASIARAQAIAIASSKTYLYVAGGVYMGTVDLVPGLQIFGGYSPTWSVHDPVDFQSAIVGVDDGEVSAAVRCAGIDGDAITRLDGFLLIGPDAKAAGASSYGVWSQACGPNVQITYCQIQAGDGAAGIPGAPGQNGAPGADGTAGLAARDIGHDGCTEADTNPGGAGGAASASAGAGGAGGASVCPAYDEDTPPPACPTTPYLQTPLAAELGQAGTGGGPAADGGAGGASGADSYIDSNKGVATACTTKGSCNLCLVPVKPRDGSDGVTGASGANGGAGPGCAASLGSVSGGVWQPPTGGTGVSGQSGGGGGGGGAAGGVDVHDCAASSAQYTDIGGSGGGGGSGGVGGTGGLGGGGGGGTFAVFLQATAGGDIPTVRGCSLSVGTGGAGATGGPAGSGGPGGQGGKGGASGEGAQATFCTSQGGTGGAGGNAGHGGGGGGGCGGPAVHLVTVGANPASALTASQVNQFKPGGQGGIGGYGGPSIGAAGSPGSAGLVQTFATF